MKEKRNRFILYLDVQIQQEIDAKSMAFFTYPSKQKLFYFNFFLDFSFPKPYYQIKLESASEINLVHSALSNLLTKNRSNKIATIKMKKNYSFPCNGH